MKMAILPLVFFLMSVNVTAEIIDEVSDAPSGVSAGNEAMRLQVGLNAVQKAFDNSDPRDSVIRYKYDAATTYKLRLREYMSTLIVLPKGETVAGFTLGDSANFTFSPLSKNGLSVSGVDNVVTIYADRAGADTNLSIVGLTGSVYSFYLRNDSVTSAFIPTLVAYIDNQNFVSPDNDSGLKDKEGNSISKEDADYLHSLPLIDPTQINYAYQVLAGDQTLKPMRIFDDGFWTYFQFDSDNLDKVKRLPAIYRVVDGYDNPVNTRIVKGTIIAETTNTGWTLRNGAAHLCIKRLE